jgi:hypothetical protein
VDNVGGRESRRLGMDPSRYLNWRAVCKHRFRRKPLSWLQHHKQQLYGQLQQPEKVLKLRIKILEEVIAEKEAQEENVSSME